MERRRGRGGAERGGSAVEPSAGPRRPGRALLSRPPPSPGRSSAGPTGRMSQESLLGMDEGALRKLVSPAAAPRLGVRCAPAAVAGADRGWRCLDSLNPPGWGLLSQARAEWGRMGLGYVARPGDSGAVSRSGCSAGHPALVPGGSTWKDPRRLGSGSGPG